MPDKKKILLVYSYAQASVTVGVARWPPLGLGYMASFLLREGHEVKIADLQVQPEESIFANLDADLIGVSMVTSSYQAGCQLIKKLRARGYGGRIVIGGPHVSPLPEDSLRQSGADVACVGEGEALMVKLAAGLPPSQLPAACWLDNGRFVQNPPAAVQAPLDSYPFPAYELFELERYAAFSRIIEPPGEKVGILVTSRGCPFSCDFCFRLDSRIRFRSPENIVAEIVSLKERFGYASFYFADDCFNADPPRAKEVCRTIIARGLNIKFALPNGIRADLLDDELAGLMRRAGCTEANIGVEAWDDEVRGKMGKRLKRESALTAVRLLQRHGIICTAYFIMGHFHDTPESLLRNIEAPRELNADFFQFTKFVPMPGSQIYGKLLAEGRIREKDFSKFSMWGDVNFLAHPTLTNEQIDLAIKRAYRRAAFRWRVVMVFLEHPRLVWNLLRNIGHVAERLKFAAFPKKSKPALD